MNDSMALYGQIKKLRETYELMIKSEKLNSDVENFVPQGTFAAQMLEHRIEKSLDGLPFQATGLKNRYESLKHEYFGLRSVYIEVPCPENPTIGKAIDEFGGTIVFGEIKPKPHMKRINKKKNKDDK